MLSKCKVLIRIFNLFAVEKCLSFSFALSLSLPLERFPNTLTCRLDGTCQSKRAFLAARSSSREMDICLIAVYCFIPFTIRLIVLQLKMRNVRSIRLLPSGNSRANNLQFDGETKRSAKKLFFFLCSTVLVNSYVHNIVWTASFHLRLLQRFRSTSDAL